MLHQKKGNTLAHNHFGLKAKFVGLVATLKPNQTRLIAFVDINSLRIMKEYLTTILLCAGVVLISKGILEHSTLSAIIGEFMLGFYNASIQKK